MFALEPSYGSFLIIGKYASRGRTFLPLFLSNPWIRKRKVGSETAKYIKLLDLQFIY